MPKHNPLRPPPRPFLKPAMRHAVKPAVKMTGTAIKKALAGASKAIASSGRAMKFMLPKTLAGCADALYKVREERLGFDRSSTALKKDEGTLRDYLIEKLSKGESSGVQGLEAFAYVDSSHAFNVKDWGAFYAAVVAEYNKAKTPGDKLAAFRYLNRAISKEPIEEKWDAGVRFPGVERIPVKKVMLSKRKGKR